MKTESFVENYETPDGRYKIVNVSGGSSDHFYHPDLEWEVRDTKNNHVIMSFYGNWSNPDEIQDVMVSKDGKEALAFDGHGKIVERYAFPYKQKKK